MADTEINSEAYTRIRWRQFAAALEELCVAHSFEMAWLITLPFVRCEFKPKPL